MALHYGQCHPRHGCPVEYEMGDEARCQYFPLTSSMATCGSITGQALLWVSLGLGCYAISLGCWMLALTKLPLSIAYPSLSVSYILVALSAWWLFDEPLSLITLCGSLLVFIGVP
ncbi:EamA family transporter [Vibrio sp. PP-XX7]